MLVEELKTEINVPSFWKQHAELNLNELQILGTKAFLSNIFLKNKTKENIKRNILVYRENDEINEENHHL